MFSHIATATYLSGYTLRVAFDNGAVKDVDLRDELHGEVFAPLQKLSLFKKAAVNPFTKTVEWPNGADFAPEFLYEIGKEVKRKARARPLRV